MKVIILEKKKRRRKIKKIKRKIKKKAKTSPSLKLIQELWTLVPVVCDGSVEIKVAIVEKLFKLSSKLMQEVWTTVPCSML